MLSLLSYCTMRPFRFLCPTHLGRPCLSARAQNSTTTSLTFCNTSSGKTTGRSKCERGKDTAYHVGLVGMGPLFKYLHSTPIICEPVHSCIEVQDKSWL